MRSVRSASLSRVCARMADGSRLGCAQAATMTARISAVRRTQVRRPVLLRFLFLFGLLGNLVLGRIVGVIVGVLAVQLTAARAVDDDAQHVVLTQRLHG